MKKYIFIGIVTVVVMIGAMFDIHWSQPRLYHFSVQNDKIGFTSEEGGSAYFLGETSISDCVRDIAQDLRVVERGVIQVKEDFHWFAAPTAECRIVAVGDPI